MPDANNQTNPVWSVINTASDERGQSAAIISGEKTAGSKWSHINQQNNQNQEKPRNLARHAQRFLG